MTKPGAGEWARVYQISPNKHEIKIGDFVVVAWVGSTSVSPETMCRDFNAAINTALRERFVEKENAREIILLRSLENYVRHRKRSNYTSSSEDEILAALESLRGDLGT